MKYGRHHYQEPLSVNRRLEMVHLIPSFYWAINQAHIVHKNEQPSVPEALRDQGVWIYFNLWIQA